MKKLPQQKDMSELILRLLLTSAAVISIEGSPRTFVDESLVNNITQYPKLVDNDILIKTKQEAQQFLVEPSDQAVNPGEDFVLECVVENKKGECRLYLMRGNYEDGRVFV